MSRNAKAGVQIQNWIESNMKTGEEVTPKTVANRMCREGFDISSGAVYGVMKRLVDGGLISCDKRDGHNAVYAVLSRPAPIVPLVPQAEVPALTEADRLDALLVEFRALRVSLEGFRVDLALFISRVG